MSYANHDATICTACTGTLLLEFAALSHLTGNPEFEVKAHRAMEFIWQKRHQGHNLVGTTINIHNEEWTRKESGVGAGIDSYYEYCLKSYILLGQPEYLRRFEKVSLGRVVIIIGTLYDIATIHVHVSPWMLSAVQHVVNG